jgi:hypothetical protein
MCKHIEKQRETKLIEAPVTAMFHGSQSVFGCVEFPRARESAAPSQSSHLTDAHFVHAPSSPPRALNADLIDFARHRTRRLTMPSMNKLPAEKPMALSVLAVFSVNPNKRRGSRAVAAETPKSRSYGSAAFVESGLA